MGTDEAERAEAQQSERHMLEGMIRDARAELTRLETALGRLDSGQAVEHPVIFWRKRRNMTQSELARAVGVTPAAICRIEHAPGFAARPETRLRIAAVLNVAEEWLHKAQD